MVIADINCLQPPDYSLDGSNPVVKDSRTKLNKHSQGKYYLVFLIFGGWGLYPKTLLDIDAVSFSSISIGGFVCFIGKARLEGRLILLPKKLFTLYFFPASDPPVLPK